MVISRDAQPENSRYVTKAPPVIFERWPNEMTIRDKTDRSMQLVFRLGVIATPLLLILAVVAGFWSMMLFNVFMFAVVCLIVGTAIYLTQGIKCPACKMRLGILLWSGTWGTQSPLRSCPYCKTGFETELPINKGQQSDTPNPHSPSALGADGR